MRLRPSCRRRDGSAGQELGREQGSTQQPPLPAAFATFVVLLSVDGTGAVPLVAPSRRCWWVAVCPGRRAPEVLLRFATFGRGTIYAIAGLLVSLAYSFGRQRGDRGPLAGTPVALSTRSAVVEPRGLPTPP